MPVVHQQLNAGTYRLIICPATQRYSHSISSSLSLYQNVSYGFNMLILIISAIYSVVSTCVRVVVFSSSAKADPGVTGPAVVSIIT